MTDTTTTRTIRKADELLPNWDKDHWLARDSDNRNLLAWFGFEEAARHIENNLDCAGASAEGARASRPLAAGLMVTRCLTR